MNQILRNFGDYSSRRIFYAAVTYLIFYASYVRVYFLDLDEDHMDSVFSVILSFFEQESKRESASVFHFVTLILLILLCFFISVRNLKIERSTIIIALVSIYIFMITAVFLSLLMSFPLFFALPVFVFSFFKSPGIVLRIIKYTVYILATLLYASLTVNALLYLNISYSVSELWLEINGFIGAVCLVLSMFFFLTAFDPPPGTAQSPQDKGQ